MGGCNCKSERKLTPNGDEIKISLFQNIIGYTFKSIGYLLFVALLPIINIVILWSVFKMLVLNKQLDMKAVLVAILSKFSPSDNDDDDDDDDDEYYKLTEDDVVMVDIENITEKTNK